MVAITTRSRKFPSPAYQGPRAFTGPILRAAGYGILLALFLGFAATSFALDAEPGAVFVRVLDVGAGLCCVIEIPDAKNKEHFIIYDAGPEGETAFDGISELIPDDSNVDLMVLSHTDTDHVGAVDKICDAYRVRKIIHSGMNRSTTPWKNAVAAIKQEHEDDGCTDVNLKDSEFPEGATYRIGIATVTMVCGFNEPPKEWGKLNTSEKNNAGSIVIRVQYKGKSILFCGDAVGRHIGDPPDACIAEEKYMVDNAEVVKIDSDVMIAPHHGADNGSSTAFIKAVSPEFVIFSAGHRFHHPLAVTAKRYLDYGVPKEKMFRTDRGDDEGDKEWNQGRKPNNVDKAGDDDVDILIRETGELKVAYRQPE